MSILNTITKGKTPKPPIILLYGQEGVGKSTFAAKAPGTIFVPTEDGLNEIDCQKFPISKTYGEFKEKLLAIRDEEHDFQTLAIDSISAAERMLFRYICERYAVSNILDAAGGYGKGYKEYTEEWLNIFELLSEIRNSRKMSIILIGHCDVVRVFSPRKGQYDQFQPRLYKKAMDILVESTDGVSLTVKVVGEFVVYGNIVNVHLFAQTATYIFDSLIDYRKGLQAQEVHLYEACILDDTTLVLRNEQLFARLFVLGDACWHVVGNRVAADNDSAGVNACVSHVTFEHLCILYSIVHLLVGRRLGLAQLGHYGDCVLKVHLQSVGQTVGNRLT